MADGACEDRIYEEDKAFAEARTEEALMEELRIESAKVNAVIDAARAWANSPTGWVRSGMTPKGRTLLEAVEALDAPSPFVTHEEVQPLLRGRIEGPLVAVCSNCGGPLGPGTGRGRCYEGSALLGAGWCKLYDPVPKGARTSPPSAKDEPATPPKVVECRLCRAWHRAPACELPAAAR